jgi:branched-chain amino acid transport system substrate-binding protein
LLVWITDVDSMGFETAQGLVLINGFYWDRDDETRAMSKRFFAEMRRMRTWAMPPTIPRPCTI